MENLTSIAVIIPCYNHANVLRRTLLALKSQTQQPAEIVLVDDASTDHPEKILAEVFPDAANVQYLRLEKNSGAPFARNRGAELTSSPYLLFLDADAELIPEALARFIEALEQNPEAEFAYANFRWGRRLFKARTYDPDMLRKANYIHTSSLIRRAAFPGFDESLKKFQDWDLWLTLAKQGKPGFWIDRELYTIVPRRKGQGISSWLPRITHRIPWPILGWMPREIKRYREAEQIIRKKHHL